ncbi:MAG: Crp/Fnr family transcriptional regulator [Lachnospiraceae bacterium]|nr:Crp/Fnr family transcriptional regulator [Lachnospiraceae bacterium]MDY5742370.1 Crp/Fnr family transcriptional regulator [Lachnospiraceae bacterium]
MLQKAVVNGRLHAVLKPALEASLLCRDFSEDELIRMLEESDTRLQSFAKGEFVFRQEDEVRFVYILVSGLLAVCKDSEDGRRHIVTRIERPGDLFAEVYAFIPAGHYDYYAETQKKSLVLAIPKGYFDGRATASPVRELMMSNMLSVLATKAFYLNSRLYVLGGGSIREKVLRLLEQQQTDTAHFMTREELADSLGVSRPALSRELMRMLDEGLITMDGKGIGLP